MEDNELCYPCDATFGKWFLKSHNRVLINQTWWTCYRFPFNIMVGFFLMTNYVTGNTSAVCLYKTHLNLTVICRTHKCISPVHIFKTLDRSTHQAACIPSQCNHKLLPTMHRAKSVNKVEANLKCSYFRLGKEESFKQPQKKHANSPKEYLKLRSEAGYVLLWGDSTNHRTTPQVGYVFPPKPLFSPSSFGQRRLCVPALITPDSKLSLWRCCRNGFDVRGVHLQPGNPCYPRVN